jgi:hypothetical protein
MKTRNHLDEALKQEHAIAGILLLCSSGISVLSIEGNMTQLSGCLFTQMSEKKEVARLFISAVNAYKNYELLNN